MYKISERFVQDLAKRTSPYPQNPQKVFEEYAQLSDATEIFRYAQNDIIENCKW